MWTLLVDIKCEIEEPFTEEARHQIEVKNSTALSIRKERETSVLEFNLDMSGCH